MSLTDGMKVQRTCSCIRLCGTWAWWKWHGIRGWDRMESGWDRANFLPWQPVWCCALHLQLKQCGEHTSDLAVVELCADRQDLLHPSTPKMSSLGWTNCWERAELRELTQSDWRDVPCHLRSHIALKAWGKEEGGRLSLVMVFVLPNTFYVCWHSASQRVAKDPPAHRK